MIDTSEPDGSGARGRVDGAVWQSLTQAFVGRERELATLRACLNDACHGRGNLTLVSGDAGIGKTTLVERFSDEAPSDALVLWGHAYDLSVTPPYGPWLEILRDCQPNDDLPSPPSFISQVDQASSPASQASPFTALTKFFHDVAVRHPLVMVLDDLHWADQASFDFLRFLARDVDRHRILIVATYRTDELHRAHPLFTFLPILARESNAIRIDLRPLDSAGQRALVENRYTLNEADQHRLVRYLADHAQGNPLYAGELLRTLEEHRALFLGEGGWHLGDPEQVPVPTLVRQVIEGRLSQLSENTRQLLQVAAVIGQQIPVDLWQQVSEATDSALIAAIEQGRSAHLIEEDPRGHQYRFCHALLRQAFYEEAIVLNRRVWHRKIADTLAEMAKPNPHIVSYHYQQANDDRAAEWLLEAGEQAMRAYAWSTAVERFEAALAKLTERAAPVSERAKLLFRLAFLRQLLDPSQAVGLLRELRSLAVDAGEQGLAVYSDFASGVLRCFHGEVRQGISAMEEAVAKFRALSEPERERIWSLLDANLGPPEGTLVAWLATAGQVDKAVWYGERMIAETSLPPSRVGQGDSTYADGRFGLAMAYALQGRTKDAQNSLRYARDAYQEIEHHTGVAGTFSGEIEFVHLPYCTDELSERASVAAAAQDAASRAVGAYPETWPTQITVLPLLVLEGSWGEARKIAESVSSVRNLNDRLFNASLLAPLARAQGDAALAWQVIQDELPEGPDTTPGNATVLATLQLQRTAVSLSLDALDLTAARAWLEAHDRWLEWSGAVLGKAEGAMLWGWYHHARGDGTLARQCGEEAIAYASEPRQPLALIAILRFLGELDTGESQFERAEWHLQQSLELANACRAPFERALTQLNLAKLRVAQHRLDDAKSLLDQVRAICEPLGAYPTLTELDALHASIASLSTDRRASFGALTGRELQVLQLVSQGLTDGEIASQLGLSPRTVHSHLRSTYTKLDVRSRAGAVRAAFERGLL